jgi:hypothetical protein
MDLVSIPPTPPAPWQNPPTPDAKCFLACRLQGHILNPINYQIDGRRQTDIRGVRVQCWLSRKRITAGWGCSH